MPNEYSIEIHRYLKLKITEAEKIIEENGKENPNVQGRLDELHWIRKYLGDNIDLRDFNYY